MRFPLSYIFTVVEQRCPNSRCAKVCSNGYQLNREGCQTCKCKGKMRGQYNTVNMHLQSFFMEVCITLNKTISERNVVKVHHNISRSTL